MPFLATGRLVWLPASHPPIVRALLRDLFLVVASRVSHLHPGAWSASVGLCGRWYSSTVQLAHCVARLVKCFTAPGNRRVPLLPRGSDWRSTHSRHVDTIFAPAILLATSLWTRPYPFDGIGAVPETFGVRAWSFLTTLRFGWRLPVKHLYERAYPCRPSSRAARRPRVC